jgi:hypothetical protein
MLPPAVRTTAWAVYCQPALEHGMQRSAGRTVVYSSILESLTLACKGLHTLQ